MKLLQKAKADERAVGIAVSFEMMALSRAQSALCNGPDAGFGAAAPKAATPNSDGRKYMLVTDRCQNRYVLAN